MLAKFPLFRRVVEEFGKGVFRGIGRNDWRQLGIGVLGRDDAFLEKVLFPLRRRKKKL